MLLAADLFGERQRGCGPVSSRPRLAAMDPHALAQARSLALHRAVLARVEAEPGLLDTVRARLDAWLLDTSKPQHYVRIWRRLVDGAPEELRAALTSEDEEAIALRQTTPFAGVIDARERWRIWNEVREQAAESA
jgi:hypothetical protein